MLISEADLLWAGYTTPHRSLRSLCVVLTINQRLRRCAAEAGLTRIGTRLILHGFPPFLARPSFFRNGLCVGNEGVMYFRVGS